MPADDSTTLPPDRRSHWTHTLSVKLVFLLIVSMTVVFGLLGYFIVRLHREHLEQSTLASAERVSDIIQRSTTYYMLRNDREGLYHSIETIADAPGMVKIRILDKEGRVTYSTDTAEVSHVLDKTAEACYGCHTQSQPLTRLNRPDRFRIYRIGDGQRVLGIITPIENQPSCSNAACHAHPADRQVLGVLDTNISLAKADAQLKVSSARMLATTALAMVIVAGLSWLFVWRVVGKPIRELENATEHLAQGNLGYQIEECSHDEVGDLARSFNSMSLQLHTANEEIVGWASTLEARVDEKTKELQRAHDHMLHVEKMASLGKMAAVVAHEVNNPLSGILTYAKLLRKWVSTGQTSNEKREEAMQCLELIAAESRRCGDLIKNLLTLSRTAPMNVQNTDVHTVIDRSLLLVRHQLELGGVEIQRQFAENLPLLACDPAQIEQVLLVLIMNAKDAMPKGGTLWIETRLSLNQAGIQIRVRDDGAGIAPDILPHIFEPFLTTKETGRGVGLGLAISRGIVERHSGRVDVASELGHGTTFTITLPIDTQETSPQKTGADLAAAKTR